jgi:RNA polymerase sigma-70 factor (ECF subfamily)
MREIAEIENIPLRTVQSRLRGALKQIKKNIRKGEKNL